MVNACVSYARCHFQELATHSNWSWWIFILYAINASDEKGWNTIQNIQINVCQTFNRRDQQHHRPTRSSVNIVRPGHLANITKMRYVHLLPFCDTILLKWRCHQLYYIFIGPTGSRSILVFLSKHMNYFASVRWINKWSYACLFGSTDELNILI